VLTSVILVLKFILVLEVFCQSFLFLYYFSIFWNNYFSFCKFLYQSFLFLYNSSTIFNIHFSYI